VIGTLPVSQLAPLDYRYALDGALALLGTPPVVRCEQPELAAELAQRLPGLGGADGGALWVEPQLDGWQAALHELAAGLGPGAGLATVISLPLARLLPERRAWAGRPLGLTFGGVARLRRGLAANGLSVERRVGAHSLVAISLNSLGTLLARAGRPDLGDRLEFAARLRYGTGGPGAGLATVMVMLARKGGGR